MAKPAKAYRTYYDPETGRLTSVVTKIWSEHRPVGSFLCCSVRVNGRQMFMKKEPT